MTKSSLTFQDLAARARIPSVIRDEPHIYPGRSTDVQETEGMSTPTKKERGDLLAWNIWNHQTDCMRTTNHDAPFNIHQKPEAVLLSRKREMQK